MSLVLLISRLLSIGLIIGCPLNCLATSRIATIAGGGMGEDGIPVSDTPLNFPFDFCLDSKGNIYIIEWDLYKIRKADVESGLIVTVAGNGRPGFSEDGTPATSASIEPTEIFIDANDNLYFQDHNRIRMLDNTSQTIITVAGGGTTTTITEKTLAVHVAFSSPPRGIFVHQNGDVLFGYRNKIYEVDVLHQNLSVVLTLPEQTSAFIDIWVDQSEVIYYCYYDASSPLFNSSHLAKQDTLGNSSVLIPQGGNSSPIRCFGVDSQDNVYFTRNNSIEVLNQKTKTVDTVAGGMWPIVFVDDVPASEAPINGANAIVIDSYDNIYFVDSWDNRIRKINRETGFISTVVGGGGGDGSLAENARLESPQGVYVDNFGKVYIADSDRHRIRMVDQDGIIRTVVGNGKEGFSGDGGPATLAQLSYPSSIHGDNRHIYIADSKNHRVRKVDKQTGIITTVAGNGEADFDGDGGPAELASLSLPQDVFIDKKGDLYIADRENGRIRMVDGSTGLITTVAGNGDWEPTPWVVLPYSEVWTPPPPEQGASGGDGGLAVDATLASPAGIYKDDSGNLYIADSYNHKIRKVDDGGIITTVVGTGKTEYKFHRQRDAGHELIWTAGVKGLFEGDGGLATEASLYFPLDVWVDDQGDLYFSDSENHRIRKVEASTGLIATIIGNGDVGYDEDVTDALEASLYFPSSIALDAFGDLYIADRKNHRIRKIEGVGGNIGISSGNKTADFDQSGFVDFEDFLLFVGQFGRTNMDVDFDSIFDLNGDQIIDFLDFISLAQSFGKYTNK